jgi:hypothetical protein
LQRKKTAEVKKSVAKVKQKKIDKVEGYEDKDWHTDDSDWDYTDKEEEEDGDEDEIISANIAKKSQKRSKSHNTVHDGDKNTYLARCLNIFSKLEYFAEP